SGSARSRPDRLCRSSCRVSRGLDALGVATAATLYDPAFATLGRIFGGAARRPITVLTLAGGFASTVSWPGAPPLLEAIGWRGTYLVYAAVLAVVAAPLHAFALPRSRADAAAARPEASAQPPSVVLPPTGRPFLLMAAAFAAYALCRRVCRRICS